MKVQSHTGVVHAVAEVVDTTYFDNVLITKCGRQLHQREFGSPIGNVAKRTHRAVTCKTCKGVK